MRSYREPDWQELYKAEFQGPQRERHEPIADPETGMVFPNQHDIELFVRDDEELTALGKHLTETGEGGPAMTPDGMRFVLHDLTKTRGYWEDRARVFAMAQDGEPQPRHMQREEPRAAGEEHVTPRAHEETEDSESKCPQCAGSGLIDDEALCVVCDGYGVLLVHGEG